MKKVTVTLELFRNEGTENYNWRLKRTRIICNSGEPNGFNSEGRMLATLRNSIFPFHTWQNEVATLEHNGIVHLIKIKKLYKK